MNEMQELPNFADDWQTWLDRLVDAELTDDQQRHLLLAMEGQPDAWRRCALAFIEAQTLRREFRGLIESSPASDRALSATVALSTDVSKVQRGRFQRQSVRWFSVAASFLVAFVLGTAARGLWPQHGSENSVPTLIAAAGNHTGSAITSTAANAQQSAGSEITPVTARTYHVKVPSDDGQSEQTVEVPLIEGNEKTVESLLSQQNPLLSEAALQTLSSTGHQVEQRRTFYPVQLEDGRQAIVPVDYAEVRDPGNWQ
ncbi:MAG TPA: hypothetical protein VGJ15_13920 [Pirellulales bacterium]|jgi:hypothetical protein